MRNLNSAITTEVANQEGVFPIDLVKITVDPNNSAAVIRTHSGFRDIVFNSETYTAAGHLLGIAPIDETQDVLTNSIDIQLSGIDDSVVAAINANDPLGSKVFIYRGLWDTAAGALVTDPYERWSGVIISHATAVNSDRAGSVTVSVSCKNLIEVLLSGVNGRFTSEPSFQQALSTDRSMEFVDASSKFMPNFGAE